MFILFEHSLALPATVNIFFGNPIFIVKLGNLLMFQLPTEHYKRRDFKFICQTYGDIIIDWDQLSDFLKLLFQIIPPNITNQVVGYCSARWHTSHRLLHVPNYYKYIIMYHYDTCNDVCPWLLFYLSLAIR